MRPSPCQSCGKTPNYNRVGLKTSQDLLLILNKVLTIENGKNTQWKINTTFLSNTQFSVYFCTYALFHFSFTFSSVLFLFFFIHTDVEERNHNLPSPLILLRHVIICRTILNFFVLIMVRSKLNVPKSAQILYLEEKTWIIDKYNEFLNLKKVER